MLRRTFMGASASAVLLGLPGLALAAKRWNMATAYPDSYFHTQNIYQFVKDIKAETDIDITAHSGGSLIKHTEIFNATRNNQIQLGEVFISVLSNDNPLYQLDSIPFLATTYEEAFKLYQASKEDLARLLEESGLVLLYTAPFAPQGLYISKDVHEVSDLKGVKFRAYNAVQAKLAQLLGMTPTHIEASEIPQAFSTGMVEAMITSPVTGANTKSWDYVSRFYDVQAWIPKNMVFINKKDFDGLDDAEREVITTAAAAAEKRGWQMSEDEYKEKREELKENGMQVVTPDAELVRQLKEVGTTMTEDWIKAMGPEGQAIVDRYRAA